MYAVVGCSECSSLWVLEGRPETSQCPTCGQTRAHEKRKQFVTTEDPDHAREVRASMLAARQGHDDAFAELDSFAQLEERIDEAGIDDETYLAESGVDIDEVDEAAGRTTGGAGAGSRSRKEVVLDALRECDAPEEAAVVEYANEHGVQPEDARRTLEKLVRSGRVSESAGRYRLV
jgi:hypothetical protein